MIVTAILHAAMLRAALILILGMSLVPFGDSAGKLLVEGREVSPLFVAWSRFALGVLLVLPFLGPHHHSRAYYTDWRLWLRAGLIAGGIVSILTALRTEPLPNVFGAFFVGPIVSYILSALLLGERVTLARSLLVAVGFAGVLLVVRPGFGMTPGLGFAVLAGLFYGSYLTASRWLREAAPPRSLLLTQLVGGAVLTLPFGLAAWPPIDAATAGLIVWSAAASMGGNLLLILAYRMAPATRLAPFIYFQLVFATLYGVLIFGDVPDALTLTGLLLLMGSGFASLVLRR
ncbi:DMT family transporter [Ovoidimarina sediminis]|uniref:DMT family transporter n=1 Tax=Ovoidimarina sediminis TaxID=3079856 RepID=UPI002909AF41|nr:DMT family transporter [Rhodophyticola sp. MJ-SS7]MDU8942715.1 DMT family transporter [Rhodophyticola sp. MJ-SS7]